METLRALAHEPRLLIEPGIVFVVSFAIAYLVRSLILHGLRAWVARTGSRPGHVLWTALSGPTTIWALILAVHLAIQSSQLPRIVTDKYAPKILIALWIASFTLMAIRIAGDLVRAYGSQIPGALPVTTLTTTLAQLTALVIGLLLLLSAEDVQVTPILTALGVGGLAVALAMQDTLSNLFAGFYIAVSRQMRLNDYIKLASGEEGYVSDIGWRSTAIRSLGNSLVIVPNSKLAQTIVTNYHLPEQRMSSSLQVNVGYDADPDQVEHLLVEIATAGAKDIPGLLAEPAPSATLDPGFGDFALGFTLNYQIAEFSQQYGIRHQLRKRILRRLREEGIAIPYPTREIRLDRDGPA
ncbi:MAG: mechanosensitive ion channel family protein [Bryobacteraceae bacterium]